MINKLDHRDLSLYQFARKLKSKKTICPPLKKSNSEIAYSPVDKATTLADAFLNCHQTTINMNSCHEKLVNNSISIIVNDKTPYADRDRIKENEVLTIISYLKPRKAPGPDQISNLFIKNFPRPLVCLLTRVFNACLKISYFPVQWKVAKIFAIPKPGKDASIPNNHRQISLFGW